MSQYSTCDLRIVNYKSIDSLQIEKLAPFSVFAGPNGSGKSNFFNALEFVGLAGRFGVRHALRSHGGYESVRSAKRYSPRNRRFEFSISCDLSQDKNTDPQDMATSEYNVVIHDLHDSPRIEEYFRQDGVELLNRSKNGSIKLSRSGIANEISEFPSSRSALLFLSPRPLTQLLTNITVYRIDPRAGKQPDPSNADPTALLGRGNNLATVLGRMEKDPESRALIWDWMSMVVPGIVGIDTERQRIDHSTAILFKEEGTKKRFPARLMSDGTIYALCLLVAVLDRRNGFGITLIEEPERGLHPAATEELVGFLRSMARPSNPIWLTTHSRSVVQHLRLDELILVDKVGGRTCMNRADSRNLVQGDLTNLGLDSAWLSNLLDGGLPW